MIAIFSLLGLVLFGGGLYAIYDGWPYLVLERGFTEVIIGSISSTGGLLMMSLAWVLKQLKAIRKDLAEAAETRLSAPAPLDIARPAAPRDAAEAGEIAAPSPVLPLAVGAGAFGVGAAAVAAAVREKPEAAETGSGSPERDLFGALMADHLTIPEDSEEPQEEAAEPARDEALPDMFEAEIVEVASTGADHSAASEEESPEPFGIAATEPPSPSEDEELAGRDDETEPATLDSGADEAHPAYDAALDVEEPPSIKSDSERDEFAALRESLTSQLGGLNRQAGRIEPSLSSEDDPFAEVENWSASPGERREPSFDASSTASGNEAGPPVPAWPPRTEPHGSAAPASHALDQPLEAGARDDAAAGEIAEEVASIGRAEPDEPEQSASEGPQEPAPGASNPAAQEPAASEEGIVGAYQVGETHFTIYADGSIRARTPDGEYSFASMDELKVYLASEKSRLGV